MTKKTIKPILFVVFIAITSMLSASSIDNVLNVLFYTENESSYLILHESLFHPTAASYEQGKLRSQGYTSSRISVYQLNTGALVAQKDMGRIDSTEACLVLGCSANNLWIYSHKYKSGIQSLHPLTLKRNISQAKIYSKLNISIGRFIEPLWYDTENYYGFDPIQEKLIVSNEQLKMFYIDTKTFATQPITSKIEPNKILSKYLSVSTNFKDSVWKLSGYKYMKLSTNGFELNEPTFLYGQFVMQQNKVQLFKHFFNIQESVLNSTELTENKKNSQINQAKQNITNLIDGSAPDKVLLQNNKNSFFILSKQNEDADALLKISRIESNKFGDFKELWSTSPPGMFFNVAQARNTQQFKRYFGDVYPDFDFQFFQMYDNKLIAIHLLFVSCIDIDSGEILWYFKLN